MVYKYKISEDGKLGKHMLLIDEYCISRPGFEEWLRKCDLLTQYKRLRRYGTVGSRLVVESHYKGHLRSKSLVFLDGSSFWYYRFENQAQPCKAEAKKSKMEKETSTQSYSHIEEESDKMEEETSTQSHSEHSHESHFITCTSEPFDDVVRSIPDYKFESLAYDKGIEIKDAFDYCQFKLMSIAGIRFTKDDYDVIAQNITTCPTFTIRSPTNTVIVILSFSPSQNLRNHFDAYYTIGRETPTAVHTQTRFLPKNENYCETRSTRQQCKAESKSKASFFESFFED